MTILKRPTLAILLLAAAPVVSVSPVSAQSAPPPKLVIYGDEKCPTDANGAEIVVCVRRGAEEQFRIPKELRELEITPENESWAVRAAANDDVGRVGIGSCSTVGPGGATGCFARAAEETRRANKARRDAQARVQAALP